MGRRMNQGETSVFSSSPRNVKWTLTAGLFYSTLTLGLCLTILNSVVLEFSHRLDESLELVSKVFIINLVSYLISAFSFGIILRFVDRQKCVIGLLSVMALGLLGLPHVKGVGSFFLISSLLGLGGGGYDTAQIAWIIDTWRQNAAPFILGQNFAYSLGTLVPPILFEPYLSRGDERTHGNVTTPEIGSVSNMERPFSIAAGMVLLSILIQIGLFLMFQPVKRMAKVSYNDNNNHLWRNNAINNSTSEEGLRIKLFEEDGKYPLSPTSPNTPMSARRSLHLIGLGCIAIGFYAGLELVTMQFLPTFCHFSPLHLSEAESVRILLTLQVGYAAGRFVGIFLVLRMRLELLVTTNLIILFLANTILLFLGGRDMIWLVCGSALMGMGMSTVYPSLYAYIGTYVIITDSVAACINVSGGLISSIYPLIVGSSVVKKPAVLAYVNYFSITCSALAFMALLRSTHTRSSYVRL